MLDRKKYTQKVHKNMRKLGIFKPEFKDSIRMYVDARLQYEAAWEEYEQSGFKNTVECPGGLKKNPILTVLEDARKQCSLLSDKLGLNPKALDAIKTKESSEITGIDKAMSEISEILKSSQ